jgi:hypothetical protein
MSRDYSSLPLSNAQRTEYASPLPVVIMVPGLEWTQKEIVATRPYKTFSSSGYSKEENTTCKIKQDS